MAIVISSNIELINPENPQLWSHEDIYGKGGYVVIDTNETGKPNINDWIGQARRKEGMVVYDIATDQHHRCLGVEEGSTTDSNWQPTYFGGGTDGGGGGGITTINTSSSNGITSNWDSGTETLTVNFTGGVNNLSDVNTTDLVEGDSLIYDGTDWLTASPISTATTTSTSTIDISWNSAKRELVVDFIGDLDDLGNVDTLGSKAPNDFLMWDGNNWVATTIPDFNSTDGIGGASPNAKFITWGEDFGLDNERVLTAGDGIFLDIGNTDSTAILSVNLEYIADLFPQYTDGELDVARESSLQAVLDLLLASLGTDGFEGFSPTTITSLDPNNIVVNNQNSQYDYTIDIGNRVVTLDGNQDLIGKTYNGFSLIINDGIFTDIISGTYGFIRLEGGSTEKSSQSSLSILNGSTFTIELDTTIENGSLLTYDSNGSKWINTSELNGGNASSFNI